MPEIREPAQLVLQLRHGAAYLQQFLDNMNMVRRQDPALAALIANAMLAANHLAHEAWRPASEPPATLPSGEHFSVSVLGIVDDPGLRMPGEELPFVDVVAWWPALRRWTITHQTRADEGLVEDYTVNVVGWKPIPDLPPRGTLWR